MKRWKVIWHVVFKVTFLISFVAAESCQKQCGENLKTCSCHATCVSLEKCCADHRQFCLDISPHFGTVFGGTDFVILHVTFDQDSNLICRFGAEVETKGYVDADGHGHCISPLLYEAGLIPFEISVDNGTTYSRQGTWLSVLSDDVDLGLKVTLVNSTQWQYYGTPSCGGTLQMTWNSSLINADQVNVELWGYRETGEPHSESLLPEWMYLYTLARDLPNDGRFRFIPRSAEKSFSDWVVGSIRVSPSSNPDGSGNVNSLWSEPHALAWQLEEGFRQDSATWAEERCLEWDRMDRKSGGVLNKTTDCPCTLRQARADTARFHADRDCDIERGSECTYHPDSVHCVQATRASSRYRAGQHCCYDSTGNLVLTGDSVRGITPGRGHAWGSPPYKKPAKVPKVSHWLYDVNSFFFCCLWSDNCHVYLNHRPSSDCNTYSPPKAGIVFGNLHFISFGGTSSSFSRTGEYYLVHSDKELIVQGRMEPVKLESGTLGKTIRLSAVAMKENTSDVIEVRLTQDNLIQVLRNQQVLPVLHQGQMNLKGVLLLSSAPQNVTVLFPSGVGVEVRAPEGGMTVTVLLSPALVGNVRGLLGPGNSDLPDNLTLSRSILFTNQSSGDVIFSSGADWVITNEKSLFTYDSEILQNVYRLAARNGSIHSAPLPSLSNPLDPLIGEASKVCMGLGSWYCMYDAISTRSLEVGKASLSTVQTHMSIVEDLQPVTFCGWLATPVNGQKEGRTHLRDAVVMFSCNKGFILSGSSNRTCLEAGHWSGETTYCVSENTLGIILGSTFASMSLITLIVMIALHNRKLERSVSGLRPNSDDL